MPADRRSLTLLAALLASPGALAGQRYQPPDSAQLAQGRALCGPLADDSILLHPLSPLPEGAVISKRVKELEEPQLSPASHEILEYPKRLRDKGIQGRVIVTAVVDVTGRVEQGSVHVSATPDPDFIPVVQRYVERSLFTPGLLYGRFVRACIVLPIDFKMRGR